MSSHFRAGMAEATRRTRAGEISQATALIQSLLRGAPVEPAAAPAGPALAPPPGARAAPPGAGLRETLRRLAERARAVDVEDPASPPSLPDGARFETAVHSSAAGSRTYKLYVPANRGDGARPMVVMLHGCTQDPNDFARGTGMNALAEEFGCLVVYPAQPGSANANRCWNWFRPEDQRRDAGEPALVAGIVRAVAESEGADPCRIYVAGLSAGGAAAAVLGAEYSELFAAVGVHSGLPHGVARDLPSALAAMRQGPPGGAAARMRPTIVFHGDADRVVNPRNGTALAAQAIGGEAGRIPPIPRVLTGEASGRRFTRTLHDDGAGRTICEHWSIHGAGHAWSGGDASGSHADAQGPDASREMLRFFLSHRS